MNSVSRDFEKLETSILSTYNLSSGIVKTIFRMQKRSSELQGLLKVTVPGIEKVQGKHLGCSYRDGNFT